MVASTRFSAFTVALLLPDFAAARACTQPISTAELSACESFSLNCSAVPLPDAINASVSLVMAMETAACKMPQAELEVLFEGPLCSSGVLRSLDLRGQTLSSHASKALSVALTRCTALETLDLSDTRLGDAGLAALLPALPPSLRILKLAHNGLTDDGARALRMALGETRTGAPEGLVLRSLDLSWNGVSSSGARALGAFLASPDCPLEALNLDWNALRDRGAKDLGEALKVNTRLKRLSLRYNGIKDAGANGLSAGLRQNRALEELDLSDNGVTLAAERKWRTALANKPPVEAAAGTGKGRSAERRAPDVPARATATARSAEEDEDVDEISLDED
jgi:hypothetical protein